MLGSDHPDTLQSMKNLAHMYRLEGGNEEAAELEHGNALQAASFHGHVVMVQLLLEKVSDVNS